MRRAQRLGAIVALALAPGLLFAQDDASAGPEAVEPVAEAPTDETAPAEGVGDEGAAAEEDEEGEVAESAEGGIPALPAEPEFDPTRISFEFRVPPERGGGRIAGTADEIEASSENEVVLVGDVRVKYQRMELRAQRLVLQRDTLTLEAEGDVILDQGSQRVAAQRADFDLATETGTFWNASAFAAPDQYFTGKVVVKTGPTTFEIEDGVLTSCTGDRTPDWSLRVARADVELGGYAHITHSRVRMKKLPLFYLPYMIWPAKTDRASGFLIPNFGYTDRRGIYLGLAYYQVLGPSADLLLEVNGYEQTYAGGRAELRYQPTEGTKGRLVYDVLSDRDISQTESRIVWSHRTDDLPGGLRGVINVNDYSDFDFYREFLRSEGESTRRYLYSNAYVSGSWGVQSFSLLVDQRETFLGGGDLSTQRQLPEINYRVRKLKLGRLPLYFTLDSTASLLQSSTDGRFDVDYARYDVSPELTLPLRVAPWLSVALNAGGRLTHWENSFTRSAVDEETGEAQRVCDDGRVVGDDDVYCDEPLERTYETVDLDVVGPSFSRVFESPGGRFGKFKHVIEPRVSYNLVGDFDDQDRVPRFDEIDSLSSRESASVALVNRVLAKPSDEDEGGAFEIFSFELAQGFALDDRFFQSSSDGTRTSKESPILARLRLSPSRAFDLQGRASWSTLFSQLESTSLSAEMGGRSNGVDLTWFTSWNPETGEKRSDQARLGFRVDVVPERLSLSGRVNYNLETSEILEHRYFINYKSQCWSLLLELREETTRGIERRDFRFLLNLKNVGTFLDLSGGERSDGF